MDSVEERATESSQPPMSTLETIEFSIVIPTCNRQDDLERCVAALAQQNTPPAEVIIVNDGDLSRNRVTRFQERLSRATKLEITSSESTAIPGSGTARNTGMRTANGTIIVFIDDDTILGPSYLERLATLYLLHDSPSLAGIGGLLYGPQCTQSTFSYDIEYLFDRLFYQGTDPWVINGAGFSTRSYRVGESPETITKADWLGGSNMSFKRDIITEFRFPQWSSGREPGEDLMVGWQLKKTGYHCLIDPKMPLVHPHESPSRDAFRTNIRIGRNRIRAFKTFGKTRYLPLFVWAMFGTVLRNVINGLLAGNWMQGGKQSFGILLGSLAEGFRTLAETNHSCKPDPTKRD